MPNEKLTAYDQHGHKIKEPMIVPTPAPYIVESVDFTDEHKAHLLATVGLLWKVIDQLGIAAFAAHDLGYSLNVHTWEDLELRAMTLSMYDVAKACREQAHPGSTSNSSS